MIKVTPTVVNTERFGPLTVRAVPAVFGAVEVPVRNVQTPFVVCRVPALPPKEAVDSVIGAQWLDGGKAWFENVAWTALALFRCIGEVRPELEDLELLVLVFRDSLGKAVLVVPPQKVTKLSVDWDDGLPVGESLIGKLCAAHKWQFQGTVHRHPGEWISASGTDIEDWTQPMHAGVHLIVPGKGYPAAYQAYIATGVTAPLLLQARVTLMDLPVGKAAAVWHDQDKNLDLLAAGGLVTEKVWATPERRWFTETQGSDKPGVFSWKKSRKRQPSICTALPPFIRSLKRKQRGPYIAWREEVRALLIGLESLCDEADDVRDSGDARQLAEDFRELVEELGDVVLPPDPDDPNDLEFDCKDDLKADTPGEPPGEACTTRDEDLFRLTEQRRARDEERNS